MGYNPTEKEVVQIMAQAREEEEQEGILFWCLYSSLK